MNARSILDQARLTKQERELTAEESQAVAHAILEEVQVERELANVLVDEVGKLAASGVNVGLGVAKALLDIAIFRLTGHRLPPAQ